MHCFIYKLMLICAIKTKIYNIPKLSSHPITTQYEYSEKQYKKFHFHNQIQITLVKKGKGVLFYGNTSLPFSDNTLFILGEAISHVFIGDSNEQIESISIYISSTWLNNLYPESNFIEHFIQQSYFGQKLNATFISTLVENILNKSGITRIILFLELLEKISATTNKQKISEIPMHPVEKQLDSSRINAVFEFVAQNYNSEITLNDVAKLSNMTIPSFCRYFKQT